MYIPSSSKTIRRYKYLFIFYWKQKLQEKVVMEAKEIKSNFFKLDLNQPGNYSLNLKQNNM